MCGGCLFFFRLMVAAPAQMSCRMPSPGPSGTRQGHGARLTSSTGVGGPAPKTGEEPFLWGRCGAQGARPVPLGGQKPLVKEGPAGSSCGKKTASHTQICLWVCMCHPALPEARKQGYFKRENSVPSPETRMCVEGSGKSSKHLKQN